MWGRATRGAGDVQADGPGGHGDREVEPKRLVSLKDARAFRAGTRKSCEEQIAAL